LDDFLDGGESLDELIESLQEAHIMEGLEAEQREAESKENSRAK
jgi:hypothetical protein